MTMQPDRPRMRPISFADYARRLEVIDRSYLPRTAPPTLVTSLFRLDGEPIDCRAFRIAGARGEATVVTLTVLGDLIEIARDATSPRLAVVRLAGKDVLTSADYALPDVRFAKGRYVDLSVFLAEVSIRAQGQGQP